MKFRDGDERTEMPDPEVVPAAERRRFSAGEKLRILEEAEGCTEPGEIGDLEPAPLALGPGGLQARLPGHMRPGTAPVQP